MMGIKKSVPKLLETDPESKFITVKEFAHFRGVSVETVRRWVRDGLVKADQKGGDHGRIFILRTEMEEEF